MTPVTWNTPTYSSSDIARMQEAAVFAAREMNRRAQRPGGGEPAAPTWRQGENRNPWQHQGEEGYPGRARRPAEENRRQPEPAFGAGDGQQAPAPGQGNRPGGWNGNSGRPGFGQQNGQGRRPGGGAAGGQAHRGGGPGMSSQNGQPWQQRPGRASGNGAGSPASPEAGGGAQPTSPPSPNTGGQPGSWQQQRAGNRQPYGPNAQAGAASAPQMNHAAPSGGLFSSTGPLGGLGGVIGSAVNGVTGGLGRLLGTNGEEPSPISRVLDALNLDTERLIILVLALVLLNEKADYTLILALAYLFF